MRSVRSFVHEPPNAAGITPENSLKPMSNDVSEVHDEPKVGARSPVKALRLIQWF